MPLHSRRVRRTLGPALGATVALAAALLVRASAFAHGAIRPWPRPVDLSFHSAALADRIGIRVVLPPGYREGGRRYPVLYFLHGLPASPAAYRSLDFLRGALARIGRPALLVTVQGARESETDGEYLDSGPGHNWETAIAVELPRFVDGRFRTIPTRRGRALLGVSAGGYGAMLVGLHHLARFGAIESWSGYFHPTNPDGTQGLDLGSDAANARASAHTFVGGLAARLERLPTFIAFYVGTGDARFRSENERLDRELTAADVPHLFRLYAGAHGHGLWERHAPAWLALALAHLSPPA